MELSVRTTIRLVGPKCWRMWLATSSIYVRADGMNLNHPSFDRRANASYARLCNPASKTCLQALIIRHVYTYVHAAGPAQREGTRDTASYDPASKRHDPSKGGGVHTRRACNTQTDKQRGRKRCTRARCGRGCIGGMTAAKRGQRKKDVGVGYKYTGCP